MEHAYTDFFPHTNQILLDNKCDLLPICSNIIVLCVKALKYLLISNGVFLFPVDKSGKAMQARHVHSVQPSGKEKDFPWATKPRVRPSGSSIILYSGGSYYYTLFFKCIFWFHCSHLWSFSMLVYVTFFFNLSQVFISVLIALLSVVGWNW